MSAEGEGMSLPRGEESTPPIPTDMLNQEKRKQIEDLRSQYEAKLDALKQELAAEKQTKEPTEMEKSLLTRYQQETEALRSKLDEEARTHLDRILENQNKILQGQIEELQTKHEDNINLQMQAMQMTLEQVYDSQVKIVTAHLEQKHQASLQQLQENLTKEHKEEINRLEMEWTSKMNQLQQEHEDELNDSLLEDSLSTQETEASVIQKLYKRLSEEHKELVKKIHDGLENTAPRTPRKKRHHQEQQTESEEGDTETESVVSLPVTTEEFHHLEERDKVLEKAEDVQKTLESQRLEIDHLRARMLEEYEQLLKTRAEVMSAQTHEVEKLQNEIETLQQSYEEQMKDFQSKVQSQAEEVVKRKVSAEHKKELDDLRNYYEAQLARLHDVQQEVMSQQAPSGETTKEDESSDQIQRQRDYLQATATLTIISDEESESPRQSESRQEIGEITQETETKVKDLEQILRTKECDLDELKNLLSEKETMIKILEGEKQDLEEKFVKDSEESEVRHVKDLSEFQEKLKKIQSELEASQEQECVLEQQYDELQHQHKEEMEGLRLDLEHERKKEISTVQSEFQVQLEIELKRQAADMSYDYEEKIKSLNEEIEKLEGPVPQTTSPDAGLTQEEISRATQEQNVQIEEEADSHSRSSETSSTVVDVKTKETQEGADTDDDQDMSSSESESRPKDGDRKKADSPPHDSEELTQLLSEINRAKEEALITLRDDYENKLQLLTDDLEQALLLNDSREKALDEVSSKYESKINEMRTHYEFRIKELEDASEIDIDDIREKVKVEFVKNYEEELSRVHSEYEEKMELLKQELVEGFEAEKEQMEKEKKTALEDAEEKYDNLIESIRNGDAPEVADLVRERYDTELEMAKALMQQEFEETMESEENRFMEQHQQMMDKFTAERQKEAEELKAQHEKDIEECRNILVQEYELKIQAMEEKYTEQIDRLSQGMVDPELIKAVEAKVKEVIAAEEVDPQVKTEDAEFQEKESEVEEELDQLDRERKDSTQDLNQSLQDVRGSHAAEIARIEAEYEDKLIRLKEGEIARIEREYEEKLVKLRQELSSTMSTHSQELEAVALDNVAEKVDLDVAHSQELQDMEDRLSQKYDNDINNLEMQYENRIKDMEEKYQNEVDSLKHIIESLQKSSSSEGSFQQVPRLSHLDSVDNQNTQEIHRPQSSTPRGDMDGEGQIDRVEIREEGSPPQQVSPRETVLDDYLQSVVDDEEEQSMNLMTFESSVDDSKVLQPPSEKPPEIPRDAGIDIVSEDLVVAEQAKSREHLPELSRRRDDGDDDDFEDDENDETVSDGRSTPQDLLQTQAMAETIRALEPLSSYESTAEFSTGEQTGSLGVELKDRENRIKELESEIDDLQTKFDDIIQRRERENEESRNLERMLRSDLERLSSDRENMQSANEHLLQLLSDSVKTYMNVEETINKKLAKLVSGESADRSQEAGPPHRSPPSPRSPSGAEGGDLPHETSILSNLTDEGLDLSQRTITESIFQGPEMDNEGEELLIDASNRLQSSVAKLLDMIEDTTHQLYDTKRTQQDLVTSVSSGQHETEQISTKYQEVEERLREEVEAKEYLAMELHKAEGLIEGYSTEREQLDQQIQELEEKKEALVLELETTKNKLQDLEQAHHEASSLRSEMQRQQALMQDNVGDEAQALMLEVNTLNEDKRSLEQQIRTVHEQYDDRLHELQNAGEETERHYVELLTEKKAEVQDLRLKVESLEKQIKSNRQFIEEQAVEREQEREEYQREVDSWKKKVSDKEKQENAENRLQREVENLTEELEDRIHSHSEIVRQTQELKRDLSVEQMTANELKSIVHQLEQELDEKINSEKDLKKKISKLEYELERSEIVEDYDDQEAPPAEGDEVISESEDSTTGTRTTRRRRMLPSHISLQQEEALIQEKEQLQSQLEEQLKQISALRNQLDEMRHRSDYSDESQALSLQRQLDRQKEVVEEKEKQVAELKEEIDDLTSAHINKDKYIENLTNQLQAAATTQGDTGKPNEELLEQLKDENQQLMVKLRSAQGELDSTPLPVLTQSLMEEKNQELDHLNLQLQELQTEIGKLRSREVLSSLQSEVDRLQNELDKRDTDNIRESQTYSVDGSLTDTEGPPAVSDSFAEKTNLQQELQDSMAQKLEEITELQEEVEQLKSSLQDRDTEIEALKKDLETKKESNQEKSSSTSSREDNVYLNEMLQEKEALLLQTNVQIEALTSEVESLTDFQMKLQEDFDTVQVMLEEKEKEIDTLTKELTEKASDLDTSETMVKLEQEILKLKKDLKEKDNVIEEKAEEMYLLNEKIEQQASVCSELDDVKITLANKEAELLDLKEGGPSSAELKVQLEERTDQLERKSEELEKMRLEFDTVKEHLSIAENLQKKLEQAGLLGPDILLREKEMELIQVREELAALKAKLQSEEKEEELQQQKEEIQRLKEELTRKEENDAEEIEERDRQIKKLQDELTELQNKDDELQVLKAELQRMVENQEQQEEARIAELAKPRASEMVSLELAPESEQLMLQFSAHDTQRVPVREEMISMSVGSVAQAPPLQHTEEDIQHQAREDEIVKLQQELDLTKQETDELGVTLREKDESVQKLQTELSQLKQDHDSDVMKLTEQSEHIKALKEELSNVQSLLDSSDKDDLINELEVKVELRDQQHKNNEETISQLRDEVDWLEQQVASLRQLRMEDKSGDVVLEKDKEIVTLQNEITALETKVKAVEELKTQNDEKDSVIEKLQKECEELRSESEKNTVSQYQQGGNNDTFEALEKMQEKLEKTTHELSDTFAKLHEMENKLGEVNHQMSDKENDYKNLEAEYWQATAQVSESSSKLDEMNEKLSQMNTVMNEKDEKIEHLESSLKEAQHSSSTGVEERGELKLKQEALLKEKDQELTDVKQRLKEAVELSEKQLHMVEQKDEEFVKLKLEIQQMIAEKDKVIRETKKQLQAVTREKEEEVLRMKMELEYELSEKYKIIGQLEDQVRDMQNVSAGAGDAVSMIATLQAQLRERDEAIKEIHKDLSESKQEVESKAQELTKIKAKLGEQTTPQEGISGEAQKQLDQLKHELQVAKTALSDMQKQGGWRDSRESSVERAALLQMSSSVEDLDEDLELKDPEELRRDVRLLQKELERKNSELSLFHSTASMSAKDFVKKVMELREELGNEHQRHVQELTERARQEADTNMAQLRIKYEDEIEHMKLLHNKEMDQKIGEVKREMDKAHKTDINKLLARHQQELELIRIRSHTQGSHDVSALDIAQQLQSEVAMAEHLDNRLMRSLTQQPDGQDVADTSSVAESETDMDENVSARLQMLLNRLHNEGVQMLTMSELQFLNRHMGQSNIDKEVDIASLQAAWENEKQTLLSAVQSLKDLLAQTHKLRGIDKTSDASDWRGELLRTIGYVFAKERENLLAELRSHVLSQPNVNLTEIQSLEQKIKNQEAHQKASLEQIFRADRQSLLAEIRDLRAHSNIASMRHQEEKERLAGQLNTVEEENSKRERQLKRQIQLLEYKLQQEKIIQDDLKTSLEVERDRTSELSNQLSREKNSNLDLHTDVSNLQIQVSKLKDALEREQSRFVSVTSALEEEKGKCHQMSELLERERSNSRHLHAELDNMKLKAEEKDHVDRLIEQLEVELSAERNRRMQSENEEELDKVTISNLQQELEIESKNQRSTESEFKARVKQLTTAVDLEKAKSSDLQGALDRERALNDKLRQSLDSERRSLLESTDRENSIFEDMQMEIDTEKAKSNDLRNTLEREKQRLASQMSSLDSEKNILKEEVEQERQKIRQMKNEIDQLQIQKLDITRHYEHERDQVSRLKVEREQLRSEVKSLKDTRNEEERQRDTEKVTERRSQRQIERERDDNKMKLHENELEIQRLTQKILDLEDQVSVSREKEFDAVRALEEEKLRNLQNQQSYHANGNQESPRSDDSDYNSRWNVYKTQLESICQSLQFLILQYQDQLCRNTEESVNTRGLEKSLKNLLLELKQTQMPLVFESRSEPNLLGRPDANTVNERVLHHNSELTNFVSRLTEEKMELRNTLGRLEEEIWRYRQRDNTAQNGDLETSHASADNKHLEDRANWAKERLSLQLALNQAESENDQLKADLRIERERRSSTPLSNGHSSESDRERIQRLYGKYLRADSYRKALIYQKKYLLLLLGGFQDCEETTLALIARMGVYPSPEAIRGQHRRPFTMFRSAARVVIAVSRMKYLVRKWRRATRVGSPVMGGTVNLNQGYTPSSGSFSPPRLATSPRMNGSALGIRNSPLPSFYASALPSYEPQPRQSSTFSPSVGGNGATYFPSGGTSSSPLTPASGFNGATNFSIHTTPPTKDYSSRHYSSPKESSGARRKILSSSSNTPKSATPSRRVRIAEEPSSLHDDYINRLENLQLRLGNMESESPKSRTYPRR